MTEQWYNATYGYQARQAALGHAAYFWNTDVHSYGVIPLGITSVAKPLITAARLAIAGEAGYQLHLQLESHTGRDIPVSSYVQPNAVITVLREASQVPGFWTEVGPYIGALALATLTGRSRSRALSRRTSKTRHPARRSHTPRVPARAVAAARLVRLLATPTSPDVSNAADALLGLINDHPDTQDLISYLPAADYSSPPFYYVPFFDRRRLFLQHYLGS